MILLLAALPSGVQISAGSEAKNKGKFYVCGQHNEEKMVTLLEGGVCKGGMEVEGSILQQGYKVLQSEQSSALESLATCIPITTEIG